MSGQDRIVQISHRQPGKRGAAFALFRLTAATALLNCWASRSPNAELRGAWEYYHTPRCEHPNAPGFTLARNLTQIITYDAYNKAEAFLTQPVLAVAGSKAGSKWMSDDLIARAASKDKNLYVVEGADHMDLYDVPKYVDEAVWQLAPFFNAKLK